MGLTSLMERLQYRATDTWDTPSGAGEVASEPIPVLGCTRDTSDTCQVNQAGPANDSGADTAHSALTGEFGDPDAQHDENSASATDWYMAGYVWSDAEIAQFTQSMELFGRSGMAETDAEKLAERLLKRDRDGDDRYLCAECWHCSPPLHCGQGQAVLDVLQRCDHFNLHPELERQDQ